MKVGSDPPQAVHSIIDKPLSAPLAGRKKKMGSPKVQLKFSLHDTKPSMSDHPLVVKLQ